MYREREDVIMNEPGFKGRRDVGVTKKKSKNIDRKTWFGKNYFRMPVNCS